MPAQPACQGAAIDFNVENLTFEQGLQLIASERVEPLLHYLRTGVFENKTNMTFMMAYTVVVQFGDQTEHSHRLYLYYKKVITDFCEEEVVGVDDCSGDELLGKLASMWDKQTILSFWMQRVFQYLDRFFTQNSDFPDLFSSALRSFQDVVYDRLKDRCVAAMIEAINRERNSLDVDRDVLKRLVEMLCTVGDTTPKIPALGRSPAPGARLQWNSTTRDLYKSDFESKLLKATADFYEAKVVFWLADRSCPELLQEIARRLEDEDRRVELYLDRSSEEELRTVVQRELILKTAKRAVEMDSGCQSMLENKKYAELTLMFRLLRREPSVLKHMTCLVEPYIEDRVKKIADDQAMIEDPPTYVKHVLDLKTELDDMVAQCFENHTDFQKARNNVLEKVLNKDTRCAKYLSIFTDLQLKRGLKGKNEGEMTQLVDNVVSLFVHLKDKDIFLDFYKRGLSKRLLNKLSVSNDAEDAFITKLKVECGQQAIQKLASMMTDMALSDQLQEDYNKLPHGGAPGGVTHEVRVLQTNAWPEKPDETNIVPCEEMIVCTAAFEKFYDSKHSGRKLRWMYNMGSVELSAPCLTRRHILVVSAYQALTLLLFNKQNNATFKQLCEATKIPKDECRRQVLSMTVSKHRLLLRDGSSKEIEDETQLDVNMQFAHEKMKVVVGLIKKEEKAEQTAVAEAPVDRKHVVDAAIVRVMKARKVLDHNSLSEEVFKLCTLFKPQPQQIKMQIEALIEREFLERDADRRNYYIYRP